MKSRTDGFRATDYIIFAVITAAVLLLCICLGSVRLPLKDTVQCLRNAISGAPQDEVRLAASIILPVRLPRVLCVAIVGASLSLGGAAMQGLLKNPLADGSTLGVSSGASLGAIIAIAFGVTIPGLPCHFFISGERFISSTMGRSSGDSSVQYRQHMLFSSMLTVCLHPAIKSLQRRNNSEDESDQFKSSGRLLRSPGKSPDTSCR